MRKLKLQYFGHLMRRADSLEKILMLGKTEGKRRRRRPRIGWLDSITDSMDMNLRKLGEIAEVRGAWCAAARGVAKIQIWLSSWTATKIICKVVTWVILRSLFIVSLIYTWGIHVNKNLVILNLSYRKSQPRIQMEKYFFPSPTQYESNPAANYWLHLWNISIPNHHLLPPV